MGPLTIAVPSGRLLEAALGCLRGAGFIGEVPARTRSLLLPGVPPGSRVLVAKPVDLPIYVEHGAADVGVAGKDVLLEQGRDVYELLDLRFGFCRGVVALPEDRAQDLWTPGRLVRIATKYPRITEQYCWREGRPVEIIQLYGSVELAPRVNLADGIMDLVMTGRTLRANHLVEVAEVFQSTARLVVNRTSLRTKGEAVQALIERLGAVVASAEAAPAP